MDTQDIVKLVRRLMKQFHRGKLTKQQVEDQLRASIDGADLEWALEGVNEICAYHSWPPQQQGTRRVAIRRSTTGRISSRLVEPGDHISQSEHLM